MPQVARAGGGAINPRMADPAEIMDAPREAVDEDNVLTRGFIDDVRAAIDAGDPNQVRALVEPLHEADIADLFEQIGDERRQSLAVLLGDILDPDVLAEMNEWVRDELIDELEPHQVADVVQRLDTDDAVSIIEELNAADQREVLRSLPADDRAAIEEALSYPEESAGRLMQRELIAVPEHWSVGQVIDYVRDNPDQAEDFWEIFVVDPTHKPVGTMKLSSVLRTPRVRPVAEIMQAEQTLIPADMDQEEVALRFQKYALISAAVIDSAGRLVGVITVDDIVHVISEEAGEDILRLSGAGSEGDINEPILLTVRTRLIWLVVNLGTAMIAASVVGLFEGEIAKFALLAALMGIVSGMGGNAGTQTLAVVVRALATNQLTGSNNWTIILRELRIAATNGFALGLLIGIGAYFLYGRADLAMVFGLAILINNLVAGLSGVMIPLTLEKAGIDPAISSAVFVTMMTDCLGFFTFLGLAKLWGLHG